MYRLIYTHEGVVPTLPSYVAMDFTYRHLLQYVTILEDLGKYNFCIYNTPLGCGDKSFLKNFYPYLALSFRNFWHNIAPILPP